MKGEILSKEISKLGYANIYYSSGLEEEYVSNLPSLRMFSTNFLLGIKTIYLYSIKF